MRMILMGVMLAHFVCASAMSGSVHTYTIKPDNTQSEPFGSLSPVIKWARNEVRTSYQDVDPEALPIRLVVLFPCCSQFRQDVWCTWDRIHSMNFDVQSILLARLQEFVSAKECSNEVVKDTAFNNLCSEICRGIEWSARRSYYSKRHYALLGNERGQLRELCNRSVDEPVVITDEAHKPLAIGFDVRPMQKLLRDHFFSQAAAQDFVPLDREWAKNNITQ